MICIADEIIQVCRSIFVSSGLPNGSNITGIVRIGISCVISMLSKIIGRGGILRGGGRSM